MAKITKENFIKALKEMSLLEIKELVDGLKEEFGIDPSLVAQAPQTQEAKDSEPTEVSVVLTSFGTSKINVIKAVRQITSLGLMDAKKAVESLPYTIKENIAPNEAKEIATKLKEAGATTEVK